MINHLYKILISMMLLNSFTLEAVAFHKLPWTREFRCEFRIESLETIAYDLSEATDINDKGEIVGTFIENGKKHAFLCLADGHIQVLYLPGDEPHGLKINNRSQIAGNVFVDRPTAQGIMRQARGFFFDPQQGITIIEPLSGNWTRIQGINDLGQVVGSSETSETSPFTSTKVQHAFIWENGSMTDLGTLDSSIGLEGDMSEAIAINNLGEVVGMSNRTIQVGPKKKLTLPKPFYWNGTMKEVPCGNQAIAINNKGVRPDILTFVGRAIHGSMNVRMSGLTPIP